MLGDIGICEVKQQGRVGWVCICEVEGVGYVCMCEAACTVIALSEDCTINTYIHPTAQSYNVNFFKQFSLVMNALDNKSKRLPLQAPFPLPIAIPLSGVLFNCQESCQPPLPGCGGHPHRERQCRLPWTGHCHT